MQQPSVTPISTRCPGLIFALVIAWLAMSGCNGGSHGTNAADTTGESVSWRAYNQPDGTFSVELPGKPTPSERKESTQKGQYTMQFVGARLEDADFEIGCANVGQFLKQMSEKQVIESVRDDIGAVFGTRNFAASTCRSGAVSGMEYRLDLHQNPFPDGSAGDYRVFVANGYVYEQVVIGKSEQVKGPMRDRFFSSLHLKDISTPMPAGVAAAAPLK